MLKALEEYLKSVMKKGENEMGTMNEQLRRDEAEVEEKRKQAAQEWRPRNRQISAQEGGWP